MTSVTGRIKSGYERLKQTGLAPFLETKVAGPHPDETRERQETMLRQISDMVRQQGELIAEQQKTFNEFRQANDQRLAELEKRGQADVLLEEKTDRLSEELQKQTKLKDELQALQERYKTLETRMNRPGAGGGQPNQPDEYRSAFEEWFRTGREGRIEAVLERRDMNIGTPADGGYAVPEDLDRSILELLRDVSPMRQIANVVSVSGSDWKKLVNTGGTASGWVGETAARQETATPALAEIAPTVGEIYANPAVTQTALDDIFFDVEKFLSNEVRLEFAEQEGLAFITGDGASKPEGVLTAPQSAQPDGVRPFGTVQVINSGDAATIPDLDVLMDLQYALKTGYRQNARWLMSSITANVIRKFKDSTGQYLWQPSLQSGAPDKFLGHPVTYDENMPSIAANAIPIAWGDWQRAYTIVDRMGVRTLRDPFTNKPYVHFYTTKRVGGKFMDTQAYKLLKIAL